jgi:quinol monooxygenase YgiN
MYARLSTYRFTATAGSGGLAESAFLPLMSEQEGCRGVWMCAEEGDLTSATWFSLWDTREQAEQAGDRARPRMMELFAEVGTTLTGPPEVKVMQVQAGSVLSTA